MNKYERLVKLRESNSLDTLAETVIVLEDEIELLRGLYDSAEKEVELLSNENAKVGKELAHVNRLLASVCAENDRLTETKDENSK